MPVGYQNPHGIQIMTASIRLSFEKRAFQPLGEAVKHESVWGHVLSKRAGHRPMYHPLLKVRVGSPMIFCRARALVRPSAVMILGSV